MVILAVVLVGEEDSTAGAGVEEEEEEKEEARYVCKRFAHFFLLALSVRVLPFCFLLQWFHRFSIAFGHVAEIPLL